MATIVNPNDILLQATSTRFVSSDDLLTEATKPYWVGLYTTIINEQSGIDAEATRYGVTTQKTNYDNAVTALTAYLDTLTGWNIIPGENITIVGTTFRGKFIDVATTRQALLNRIAELADGRLLSAAAAITNIASDNILSPGEKPTVVLEYATIINEQSGIDTEATRYAITTQKTNYDNAVTALTAYLDTLTGWNIIPGSDVVIVGTTFRAKFLDVYSTRQILLNKITELTNNRLNTAQQDASNALNGLADKLTAGTSYTLTGVVVPNDSGAIKSGSITWNPSTGALTGGSGVAITEYGLVGAAAGVPKFTIDTLGNATFGGALNAATGTFAGDLTAATGIFVGNATGTVNGVAVSTVTSQESRANSYTQGWSSYGADVTAAVNLAAQINANTTTIDGGKITTGSITAGQIAAYTITAAKIAASTITANEIAANTITAAKIAAGTITADKITAGNITTELINGNAVTEVSSGAGTNEVTAAGTPLKLFEFYADVPAGQGVVLLASVLLTRSAGFSGAASLSIKRGTDNLFTSSKVTVEDMQTFAITDKPAAGGYAYSLWLNSDGAGYTFATTRNFTTILVKK